MAVNLKIVSQVVASGTPGPAGKSAYQIAVDNGFEGTESEWLKELHPFKGWFDSVSELEEEHSAPSVGEYAYVKGATSSDPIKIYECSTEGSWSDSGRTVDTSTVQTFRSGEAVNDVDITDDSSDIEENSDKIPTAGAVANALDNTEFSTGEKLKNVGIDSEPTAGSDSLVKSGGVYDWPLKLDKFIKVADNYDARGFVEELYIKPEYLIKNDSSVKNLVFKRSSGNLYVSNLNESNEQKIYYWTTRYSIVDIIEHTIIPLVTYANSNSDTRADIIVGYIVHRNDVSTILSTSNRPLNIIANNVSNLSLCPQISSYLASVLEDGEVQTQNIADDAVTTPKIAPKSVTSDKIDDEIMDAINTVESITEEVYQYNSSFNTENTDTVSATVTGRGGSICSNKTIIGVRFKIGSRYTPGYITKINITICKDAYNGEQLASKTIDYTYTDSGVLHDIEVIFDNEITYDGEIYCIIRANARVYQYKLNSSSASVYPFTARPTYVIDGDIDSNLSVGGEPFYVEYITSNKQIKIDSDDIKDNAIKTRHIEDGAITADKLSPDIEFLDDVEICIPSTIHAVVGDTLQLYYQTIFRCEDINDYDISFVSDIGNTYPRYYELTPVAANIGNHSLNITVRNKNAVIVSQKTVTIVVVNSGTSPANNLNVLCVGASTTNGGSWPSELKRRLTMKSGDVYLRTYYDNFQTPDKGEIYQINGIEMSVLKCYLDGHELIVKTENAIDIPSSGTLTKVSSGTGASSIAYTRKKIISQFPIGLNLQNITFIGRKDSVYEPNGVQVDYEATGGKNFNSYISASSMLHRFDLNLENYPIIVNPSIGDVYSYDGVEYTVSELNISNGYLSCTGAGNPSMPSGQGVAELTKVSGNGDTTIHFVAVSTSGNPFAYNGVIDVQQYANDYCQHRFNIQNTPVTSVNIGSVYQVGGNDYTICDIHIDSTGVGYIMCKSGVSPSAGSGTLVKVSGDGDSSISYDSAETDNAIDVIYAYCLGNGIVQSADVYHTDAEINAVFTNSMMPFINQFKTVFPNCKFCIMPPILPDIKGGLGKDYKSTASYQYKTSLYNDLKMLNLLDKYIIDNNLSDYVFVCDSPNQMDNYNCYQQTTKTVNTRSYTEEVFGVNGMHPAPIGYFQIADAAYRLFIAKFCQQ